MHSSLSHADAEGHDKQAAELVHFGRSCVSAMGCEQRDSEPKMIRTHIREKTLNFCIACHEESSSQQLQLTNQ